MRVRRRPLGLVLLTWVTLAGAGCARRAPVESAEAGIRPWKQGLKHGEPGEGPRYDQPDEAAAFFVAKRAPGGRGPLPVERYFLAAERARRLPLYNSFQRRFVPGRNPRRDMTVGSWTELGPGNIGGRTRSLLIHPTDPRIMYAAGVAGGVWKTTNAGESWNFLDDLMPNLAVNSMAMDPRNPDVLYAGTGEGFFPADGVRGAGIFKSVDAGQTWRRLEATNRSDFFYVNDIVVSPHNSNRVYAATWGGVYRSLDGGASWTLVLDRRAPENGCQDLVIRTDQPTDYLFAACGRAARQAVIFRNADAGAAGRWTESFTEAHMSRTALALAPSHQNVIYALASSGEEGDWRNGLLAVYRSTHSGDPGTWEARVRNTDPIRLNTALLSNPRSLFADECSGGTRTFHNQGWYDNVIAVDPTNPDRVWAGGIDVFRSEDGGANWGLATWWWSPRVERSAHADHHVILFHPQYDGAANQTLFLGNDGGLHRADNANAAVATGSRAACTDSGAVAWRSLNNNYAVTQFYHGVPYPGGHVYIGGTQDNGTLVGADAAGAQQWREAFGGDGGYVAVNPNNPNVIYLETTRLSLRKSVDGGIRFTAATRGITEPSSNFQFIAPFVMDPNEPDRLWIGGRRLWRTNDAAANWQAASQETQEGSVTAIAVAPGNSDRVLMGTSRGWIHRSHSALSANADTRWEAARPRDGNISWIAFDPTNTDVVYATVSTFDSGENRGHVFKSTNGGETWSSLDGAGDTRLPDIPAHSVLVDPASPMTLYVGTDLGIFVSLDGGQRWAREDSPFPNTVVEAMTLDRSGDGWTLFAFTHGRGAWRVRLGGAPACSYSVSSTQVEVPAGAGAARVDLGTAENCLWSAISDSPWLIPAPAVGRGAATAAIQVSANLTNRPREGRWIVADKVIEVRQAGQ